MIVERRQPPLKRAREMKQTQTYMDASPMSSGFLTITNCLGASALAPRFRDFSNSDCRDEK